MNTKLFNEIQERIKKTKIHIHEIERDVRKQLQVNENLMILYIMQNQLSAMQMLIELYNLAVEKLDTKKLAEDFCNIEIQSLKVKDKNEKEKS